MLYHVGKSCSYESELYPTSLMFGLIVATDFPFSLVNSRVVFINISAHQIFEIMIWPDSNSVTTF